MKTGLILLAEGDGGRTSRDYSRSSPSPEFLQLRYAAQAGHIEKLMQYSPFFPFFPAGLKHPAPQFIFTACHVFSTVRRNPCSRLRKRITRLQVIH